MADALVKDAPLKKEGLSKEIKWIEIGEDFGLSIPEKVREGSNEHIYLTQTFDSTKKYMFELADELPEPTYPVIETTKSGRVNIALKHQKFTPKRNIILTSQIIWNGQRRNIRYYDGCNTIFVDKQPQDKAVVDQMIQSTNKNKFFFIDGEWGCMGYERWALMFMNICSWNVYSPFRTPAANGIFKSLDEDRIANETVSKIDAMEEALPLAKNAPEQKMLIHAAYLGISDIDDRSGNKLTEPQIRALYRKAALNNPTNFTDTYGNTAIEVRYYIEKEWQAGNINNKMNPNQATWGSKNTKICDISGLKSADAICQRIFEFSQSEEGSEFLIQLKALYS